MQETCLPGDLERKQAHYTADQSGAESSLLGVAVWMHNDLVEQGKVRTTPSTLA